MLPNRMKDNRKQIPSHSSIFQEDTYTTRVYARAFRNRETPTITI